MSQSNGGASSAALTSLWGAMRHSYSAAWSTAATGAKCAKTYHDLVRIKPSVQSGDVELLEQLLRRGGYCDHADLFLDAMSSCRLKHTDSSTNRCIPGGVGDRPAPDYWSLLHYAANYGQVRVLQFFVESCGVSNRATIRRGLSTKSCMIGNSLLHIAALRGFIEVVEFLMYHEPDLLMETNTHHCTPLHYACNPDMVSALTKRTHLASLRESALSYCAPGPNGSLWSVVDAACFRGWPSVADALIDGGATVWHVINPIDSGCRRRDTKVGAQSLDSDDHCKMIHILNQAVAHPSPPETYIGRHLRRYPVPSEPLPLTIIEFLLDERGSLRRFNFRDGPRATVPALTVSNRAAPLTVSAYSLHALLSQARLLLSVEDPIRRSGGLRVDFGTGTDNDDDDDTVAVGLEYRQPCTLSPTWQHTLTRHRSLHWPGSWDALRLVDRLDDALARIDHCLRGIDPSTEVNPSLLFGNSPNVQVPSFSDVSIPSIATAKPPSVQSSMPSSPKPVSSSPTVSIPAPMSGGLAQGPLHDCAPSYSHCTNDEQRPECHDSSVPLCCEDEQSCPRGGDDVICPLDEVHSPSEPTPLTLYPLSSFAVTTLNTPPDDQQRIATWMSATNLPTDIASTPSEQPACSSISDSDIGINLTEWDCFRGHSPTDSVSGTHPVTGIDHNNPQSCFPTSSIMSFFSVTSSFGLGPLEGQLPSPVHSAPAGSPVPTSELL